MKYFAVIFLILVGYFIWNFVIQNKPIAIFTSNSSQNVFGNIKMPLKPNQLSIQIQNNEHDISITTIEISREIRDTLGLSAPNGFREEALKSEDDDDAELKTFVKQFNKENIRYVGNLNMKPNQKIELVFAINSLKSLQGKINFTYERKVGFGGSISYFSVQLNPDGKIKKVGTE